MATIGKLKPGQTVWSVESRRMGNTMMREKAIFAVRIIEVHEQSVIASWNGNKPGTFGLKSIQKWRVNKPERKPNIFDRAFELTRKPAPKETA